MPIRFSTYRPRISSPLTRSSTVASKNHPWSITTSDVRNDLTAGKGRPLWILSTYGPGRGPPASLLEGNEYSFEELRVRFYELNAAGNQDQANQEAGELWSKAEQAMADVADNADKVINFMEEAEKKHPTRQDFCRMDGTKSRDQVIKAAESSTPFGNAPAFGQTGFGQPSSTNSAFGKPATSFSQPAAPSGFANTGFGQPAQPSAFGQPSGQPSASIFGKPSTGFGQPAFGQPSQPTPAFGQSSQPTPAFGQPAQPSGFGQPSALGGKSSFGAQPTASLFGQQPQTTSPFGQPAQTPTAFGQPSQPSSAFGQLAQPSAFGQPSQPSSAFGQPAQPSAFGQPSQPTPAFGQPTQPAPTFGQPSQTSLGFAQTSQPTPAFGQAPQPTPAFSQPSTAASPFGQSTTSTGFGSTPAPSFGTPSASTGSFGQPATSQPGNPFTQPPPTSTPSGQPSQPAITTTPFGQPSQSAVTTTPFGQPPSNPSTGFGAPPPTALPHNTNSSAQPHLLTNKPPRPLHYTQTIPAKAPTVTNPQTRKLQTYKGRQVKYINDKPCYQRPDGNGWEQVWFLQDAVTPEVVALGKEDKVADLVAEQERYTEEVRQQFAYLFDMGTFKDGKMPIVPPLREWCVYDF